MTNRHEAFAAPASERSLDKQSYSGATLVFLCGEGRFAKQTMERSDFVCVRNEPRSKHSNKKRFWLEPVIPAQGRDDIQVRSGDPEIPERVRDRLQSEVTMRDDIRGS